MNLKVKSSLIIVCTFILGMVVGMIFIRAFFPPPKMIDRIAEGRTPRGFIDRFERVINPTDSQKEEIGKILRQHFEKMHKKSEKFRDHFKQMNDSLRIELNPILTDDQKERLDRFEKRMMEREKRAFRQDRPNHKRRLPGERKEQRNKNY
jgi:hypothetical protein